MTETTGNLQDAAGRVVVGVDGSPNAMRAAEWAAREADARGAPLLLLHAIRTPDVYVVERSELASHMRAEGRTLLRRTAERVRELFPDLPVAAEVSDLAPAHALTRHSERASLVVTGTRGHGGFAGMLVGSVSRKLAVHARCPLLVVRDRLPAETLDEVVLGVEPDQDAAPIRYAFDAASRHGAAVHAVRAWRPHAVYSSVAGGYCEDLAQTRAAEIASVNRLLEPFADTHPEVKVEVSAGRGNTVPILIEAARSARLLVVGVHRHRGPLAIGAGYVVDGLLAHAVTPLAAVPIR
jgi:nucleotide-binding universal stress UspA family protein